MAEHHVGSLLGAHAPATSSLLVVPPEMLPQKIKVTKTGKIPINHPKRAKDGTIPLILSVNGKSVRVTLPAEKKRGDTFHYKVDEYETHKVFATTLQFVPGMQVVAAKPILFASADSSSFKKASDTEKFMRELQQKLLERVIDLECNACLGMTFNTTKDIVTVFGTPALVVPALPPAAASAASTTTAVGIMGGPPTTSLPVARATPL